MRRINWLLYWLNYTHRSFLREVVCFQDLGRKKREKEEEAVGPDFEPWSSKRGEILSRFTTTEKLSIVSQ